MTVYTPPSRVNAWPTMFASPAKRRCQKACESTTSGEAADAIVLGCKKGAAQRGADAEHGEEAGRDVRGLRRARLAAPGQTTFQTGEMPATAENDCARSRRVEEVQGRGPGLDFGLLRFARLDGHQARGVGIGQAAQRDGVHHGEDGGVAADAEGQRQDGDRGEGGIAREESQGVADILPDAGEDWRRGRRDGRSAVDLRRPVGSQLGNCQGAPQGLGVGRRRLRWRRCRPAPVAGRAPPRFRFRARARRRGAAGGRGRTRCQSCMAEPRENVERATNSRQVRR